jgi:hypothetical protein
MVPSQYKYAVVVVPIGANDTTISQNEPEKSELILFEEGRVLNESRSHSTGSLLLAGVFGKRGDYVVIKRTAVASTLPRRCQDS